MKFLRILLALYSVLYVVGAIYLFQHPQGTVNTFVLVVYLLVNAIVIIAGVLFERGRYEPKTESAEHEWQMTGERFIDNSTGKLMEVRYNPKTGERDYVEVKAS